jgi:hypothetical protein
MKSYEEAIAATADIYLSGLLPSGRGVFRYGAGRLLANLYVREEDAVVSDLNTAILNAAIIDEEAKRLIEARAAAARVHAALRKFQDECAKCLTKP